MMVGLVRLLIYLWWCSHIDSWDVVSWLAYISDLEFWSAFVSSIILVLLCQHSFSDVWTCFSVCSLRHVYLFHCIIIEHIPECFVWWHSVSYVGYYFTLGHTPILEFIRPFEDFLFAWSLRVIILGHTPFSAFLLGHTPSLWDYRVSCWFHGCQTPFSIFMSYHLGHPPIVILFRASPYCHFCLGHPPTFILFRASPYCHLFRASPYCYFV